MSDVEIIEGRGATILFESKRCIHTRNCVLSWPDVFVPNVVGAWIHPEAASPEEVAELAHNCASGAIRYQRDGGPLEKAPVVNLVHIRENGPLAVNADYAIANGERGLRATLCRCGASKNKPYCDGSHHDAGFQASGEPPTLDSPALARRNGPVEITPVVNGPLMMKGALEIVSGTGRTLRKVEQVAFCRCGHSQNKPYCDGTHTKVNFQSEV